MKVVTLYSTLFVLAATTLVLLASRATPPIPLDDIKDGHRSEADRSFPDSQSAQSPFAQATKDGWSFQHNRDARNYGLSEEQCNVAFPELYREIDRAVQHRKDEWGRITPDEVEVEWRGDGMIQAMIHDNQLYIINALKVQTPAHRPRAVATLNAIYRAIASYQGSLPDIEFSFSVQDFAVDVVPPGDAEGNRTTWTYTRQPHQEKLWLMPDFGMWGWPDVGLRSYQEFQAVLDQEEDEFVDKIAKIVWRGSLAVGSHDVRQGLVDHAAGQSWSDVQVLDWSNKTNIEERILTMQDHCSYMFVAQTEGNSYSGRLKYLLNCHSILFSHDLHWLELYHHLLVPDGPDQNYVRVERDYSDLPKKMARLSNPADLPRAQKIADHARSTFRERYLTPAAEACYWRALIRGWGGMMDFKPEFWKEVTEWDKVANKEKLKRKPRGAPYEAFVIMEEVDWAVPARSRKMCIGYDEDDKHA